MTKNYSEITDEELEQESMEFSYLDARDNPARLEVIKRRILKHAMPKIVLGLQVLGRHGRY